MQVLCSEGIANHTGPESCAVHREVQGEALTRETVGQPLSREIDKSVQGTDAVSVAEGNMDGRVFASACSALRGLRPWHAEKLLFGNRREISGLTAPVVSERSASRRRGVEADDARAGEVRLFHSSVEAGEQDRTTGGGVSGAKGRD